MTRYQIFVSRLMVSQICTYLLFFISTSPAFNITLVCSLQKLRLMKGTFMSLKIFQPIWRMEKMELHRMLQLMQHCNAQVYHSQIFVGLAINTRNQTLKFEKSNFSDFVGTFKYFKNGFKTFQ